MLDAHEDVVSGVPVFWVDGNLPALTATLRFRAGQADEPLPQRGYLHLLEHLAFHSLTIGSQVGYNGSVGPIFTSFTFSGPPDQVAQLLGETTRRLGLVDPGELRHEAQVLAQEERVRGGWELDNAFLYRWGARGPGVVWFRQFGLNQPEPHLLEAVARRWFVRQNATLSLDGPIPEGLDLRLPDGEHHPAVLPPPARPLPAAAPDETIVVTGLTVPGLAAEVALGIITARLNRSLRAGGSTAGWRPDHQALGPAAHLALIAPADERPGAHIAGVMAVLRQLAQHGPLPAELDEHRLQRQQARLDPHALRAAPWDEAEARLLGRGRVTAATWQAELDTVSSAAVADIARQWLDSLLLTVPDRAHCPAGLRWLFDG
ncbi:MAG: insulinase family protein, partial [Propionibacteriaceae bacterium]|nr:insulinase family protein [Propionibacteriaceae bacterium]